MGLRCLLSHDFGEAELEREREEQGNEVVITVNEVKTCTRCGERRIVSENTEVTSMEQLTATAADADAPEAEPPEPAAEQSAPQQPAASTGGDDLGVTIDDSVSTTDDAEVWTDDEDAPGEDTEDLGTAEPANMTVDDVEAAAAEAANAVDSSAEATDAADAGDTVETAEDDGVILSDDDDDDEPDTSTDRQPGEWPEYDTGDDGPGDTEWPDVEGDDEGYAAEEPADGEPEDMTFGGGFTPEITKSETSSAAAANGEESELSFTRAEESTAEYEPTVDDIETEFYCPECGLARLAGNSSMRAGDICPDCKRGYISERPT